MQKVVALARYRLEKKIEDKELFSKKKDNYSIHQVTKGGCPGQVFRDSCGDCGSSEKNKICQKNKCRKRHQQFTPSSLRKIPSCEGSLLIKDHKYLTLSRSQHTDSGRNISTLSQKTTANSSRFIVKLRELNEFFKLTEDRVIQDFLKADSCKKIADKYLIAMVFAYFKRANLALKDYTRINFFMCLYLANDVEEDEEELKYEMFPWVLGERWRDKYVAFLRMRDSFLRRIGYKAIVSRKCCDEIMAIEPSNEVWRRERPLHHAGAIRAYSRDPDDDGLPRGPKASPRHCPDCDAPDSQYDSASPASIGWYISSRESSPSEDHSTQSSSLCDAESLNTTSDSNISLNVKDLRGTLPDDDVWPATEE